MGNCLICGKSVKKLNQGCCDRCYYIHIQEYAEDALPNENFTKYVKRVFLGETGEISDLEELGEESDECVDVHELLLGNCILCGKRTYNSSYLFCSHCYNGHKNKELTLHIQNCAMAKVVDTDDLSTTIVKNESLDDFKEDDMVKELLGDSKYDIETGYCLACGEEIDDDYLFCRSCYAKYKSKFMILRIDNCSEAKVLDDGYVSTKECKDGHIVKSFAEREIDNYLYEHNIRHGYEVPFDFGNNLEVLRPDFILEGYLGCSGEDRGDVIIEYWGYDVDDNKPEYEKQKKYKLDIYRKLGTTVVCFSKKDTKNLEMALKVKLKKDNIKRNQIN